MKNQEFVHTTVIFPAGRLPLETVNKIMEIAEENQLELFFTTAQNLRLLNIPIEKSDDIKTQLLDLGVKLKKKGMFPGARVCVGAPHCNLAIGQPADLAKKISDKFSTREHTKPKFKIAISACSLGCSTPRTTDIGIISTNKGYDVYLGGKAGIKPQVGVRMIKGVSEEELLTAIDTLVEYHDKNTEKKNRFAQLIKNDDFPFSEV
ncbi:MAG: nitrite reductase [Desulfotalea sp.]